MICHEMKETNGLGLEHADMGSHLVVEEAKPVQRTRIQK